MDKTPTDNVAVQDKDGKTVSVRARSILSLVKYSPGQWVVTAGGTEDKAQKLVELRATQWGQVSSGRNVWNVDGTVWSIPGTTQREAGPILRLATDEEVKQQRVILRTPVTTTPGSLADDGFTATFKHGALPPKTAAEWGRVVIEGRKLNKHDRTRLYVMVGRREEELVGLRAALSDMEKSRDLHSEVRAQSEHELHALIAHYKMVQAFAYGDVDEIIVPDEDALIREVRRLKAALVERDTLRTVLASRWPWYNWFVAGMAAAAAVVASARALGWV